MDEMQLLDTIETIIKVALCDCDRVDASTLKSLLNAVRDVRNSRK